MHARCNIYFRWANWLDYKRVREGVTQDDWQGNTFSGINTYTNVALVGAADWVPEYDAKGLLLRDDSTVSTTKGYQYVYDAWDRLVTVKTPAGVVAEEFRYNGPGHRIGWHYDSNSSGTVNGSDPWVYFQHNERRGVGAGSPQGDFNGDGMIDGFDLGITP